jgi:cellulose synthase/poly-beta-1,6-N-acetylglucosamine synthase-like glycosyltransferase
MFPFVSLIMPIRNEAAYITRSLGAVLAQDYPPTHLEIWVVDGMSDDQTRALIQGLPGAERVKLIDNPQRIQSAGMNLAIPQAAGEIIIRVDGHTLIAPDYVRQCVASLQSTGAHNVGGAMNPVGTSPMGRAIAAAGKSAFGVPTAFHVSQQAQFTDTVYMGAWWKKNLLEVGLYDTRLPINEDYELNYRLRQAGGKIFFNPDIQSRYYGRQSLGALWRQYFRYGGGKTDVLRKHPTSLKLRHLVAPGFVAFVALAWLPIWLWPAWGWVYLGVLWLYALSSAFFSLKTARRFGWGLAWRLPVVFLWMHLAWGLGFWWGWRPR